MEVSPGRYEGGKMRAKLFVILVAMVFGTLSLCFEETWSSSSQKVVAEEKSTAKVEIYVIDW